MPSAQFKQLACRGCNRIFCYSTNGFGKVCIQLAITTKLIAADDRRRADLPAAAVKYVRRIEELIEAPVALLSTSPERDDTILMRDPFRD